MTAYDEYAIHAFEVNALDYLLKLVNPDRLFLPINNHLKFINMDYIDRIEEWFNYSFRLYLKGMESPFVISRRYAVLIKHRFG